MRESTELKETILRKAEELFAKPMDVDGRIAATGRLDNRLLPWALSASFFQQHPPKTAGREEFGREFVRAEIKQFLSVKNRMLVLVGPPGIGKTALAAQLVKTKGYVHHFNSRSQGVTNAAHFLRNICAVFDKRMNEQSAEKESTPLFSQAV